MPKIRNKYKTFGPSESSWSNIDVEYDLYYTSGTLVPLTVIFGYVYKIIVKEIIPYIFSNIAVNGTKVPLV